MAYMCINYPNHECDGCDECRQEQEEKIDMRWDAPYDEDEEWEKHCMRERNE